MNALGMIEVNSIAKGLYVGDSMLKSSEVDLITAKPVCAGKYIIIIKGTVSSLEESINNGIDKAKDSLIDSFIIPNLNKQIFAALTCTTKIDNIDAIGIIETFSLVSCIKAADVAAKSADVILMEIRLGSGLGGKSFVIMTGQVSTVDHAVTVAVDSVKASGMVANYITIPSPHKGLICELI